MAAPRQKSSAPGSKKETEIFAVFVYKWGMNRSVGMAEIARHIFKSNGFDTTMAKHLSKKYWREAVLVRGHDPEEDGGARGGAGRLRGGLLVYGFCVKGLV